MQTVLTLLSHPFHVTPEDRASRAGDGGVGSEAQSMEVGGMGPQVQRALVSRDTQRPLCPSIPSLHQEMSEVAIIWFIQTCGGG